MNIQKTKTAKDVIFEMGAEITELKQRLANKDQQTKDLRASLELVLNRVIFSGVARQKTNEIDLDMARDMLEDLKNG